MNTTINISMPKSMYEDLRKLVKRRGYTSVSEVIRDTLRDELYPEVTGNGFTPEFEKEVLKAAAEPRNKNKVWKLQRDIDEYFTALKKKLRHK